MPRFVLRTATEWYLGSPLGVEPTPVSLREVLDSVGTAESYALPSARFGLAAAAREPVGFDLTSILSPIPMWAGVVTGKCVMIEDSSGSALLLDDHDLRLIDLLDRPEQTADLLARAPLDAEQAFARLARLASAGRVHTGQVSMATEGHERGPSPNPVESVPEERWSRAAELRQRALTAYRLSSKLKPVRDLVDRLAVVQTREDHTTSDSVAQVGVQGSEAQVVPSGPSKQIECVDTERRGDTRIPVYAPWHRESGPQLSLGMLMASARGHDGGSLSEFFELHRPGRADDVMSELRGRSGPAILLCSNYLWSTERNLALASEAVRSNPELLVVHGGPDTPKYEADAERFLRENCEVAHILVRGEGERILVELLEHFAGSAGGLRSVEGLETVPGLTYLNPTTDELVRTRDGDRLADLDSLPSPYLTGEFDHIDPADWSMVVAVETNRGCPYSCAFCDWGSATLSRIRKFSLDRVRQELEWVADQRLACDMLYLTDANFGITSRDVQTARIIGEVHRAGGWPHGVIINVAKNTTKHLVEIVDVLSDADVQVFVSISLQTTDRRTLDDINRSNISIDHYRELASALRRRGHPVIGELMIGLPGQTVDSYLDDLQFMFDFEVQQRTWETWLLPNSPMNEPSYREQHQLDADDGRVIQSYSFKSEDLDRMKHLKRVDILCERLGLLRHLLRFLQWQEGIQARAVYEKLLDAAVQSPAKYPLWSALFRSFDRFPTPPVGWEAFYREVRRFISVEISVEIDDELECVMQVQQFLMPQPGRRFPATLSLAHDYPAYYSDARRYLFTGDDVPPTVRRLGQYGPSELTVESDPLDLCGAGLDFFAYQTDLDEFNIGSETSNELLSPLMRMQPALKGAGVELQVSDGDREDVRGDTEARGSPSGSTTMAEGDGTQTAVALDRRIRSAGDSADDLVRCDGTEPQPAPGSVPVYLSTLIRDYRTGVAGPFLHLGHWDTDADNSSLLDARSRANERILDLLEPGVLTDSCRVLDVACGVGGTLGSIDDRVGGPTLVGCDVDDQVLKLAATRIARAGSLLSWVQADAGGLPFAGESFDLVVSIEAMMHFASRERFMSEVCRLLKPGGSFVGSDLVITEDAHERLDMSREALVSSLRAGFAPWPDFGWSAERATAVGTRVGLESVRWVDATTETARGYEADLGVDLPAAAAFSESEAARLFTRLHRSGALRVLYFRFDRHVAADGMNLPVR